MEREKGIKRWKLETQAALGLPLRNRGIRQNYKAKVEGRYVPVFARFRVLSSCLYSKWSSFTYVERRKFTHKRFLACQRDLRKLSSVCGTL